MNTGALLLMAFLGVVVPLFVSIVLIDTNNKKLQKTYYYWNDSMVHFWCGPPLFKLWTVGVLGQ